MRKVLTHTVKCLWVFSLIAAGVMVGVSYGWEHHGWMGAMVLGLVGFGAGASLASSPSLLLQVLS